MPPPSDRESDLEWAVEYEPTSTKHETDVELLQSLEHLTSPFKFTFSQLPEFHRGVMERLALRSQDDTQDMDEDEE